MKKLLIGTLVTVIILGLLGVGGYAAYRVGYLRGVQAAVSDDGSARILPENMPHRFTLPTEKWREPRDFHYPMMRDYDSHGIFMRGIFPSQRFFSPLSLLFRAALLGLAIWLVYKLIKAFRSGQGWQLSFQPKQANPTTASPAVETQPEEKPQE